MAFRRWVVSRDSEGEPPIWIAFSGTGNGDAPCRRTNRFQHGVGVAQLGTTSGTESEKIMCGRVRLSSDYSEIKIRLKFAPNSVAPNFTPDWNKPPTAPMLVAIRSVHGERVPKMMKWGAHSPLGQRRQASIFDLQRARRRIHDQTRISGRLEARPAMPGCH
jgi:hypothetical protein